MFLRIMRWMALVLLTACGSHSSRTEYIIGVDPYWYPLDVMGKEKNIVAFTNELLQEIAKKQKLNISILQVNSNNLLPGIQEGQFQAILFSMQPYNYNRSKYDFSDLFLSTGPVLVVPKDSKVKSLKDLAGKEVAIQTGSKDANLVEVHPDVLIRSYDSVPAALNALSAGTIDGALVDNLIAESYCKDLYHGVLKIASPPLTDAGIRLMTIHNQNTALLHAFDKGLKKLKSNGHYDKLLKKWDLSD